MPAKQSHQRLLLPQAYLTNFHNRVRNDDDNIPLFITAQPTRGHKRAKIINYSEIENDLFDFDNAGDGQDSDSQDMDRAHGSTADDDPLNALSSDGKNTEDTDPNATQETQKQGMATVLPDLVEQHDPLSILKYPKIRETFLQSKLATPYRLELNTSQTEEEPIIIPVHLNFEINGGGIINDFITWNLNDSTLTPEEFATIYLRDLNLESNNDSLQQQIVSIINEQINEYEKFSSVKLPDFHTIINLTCNLNDKFYEDNLQWNLSDTSLTPEMFAELIVTELGLTRDFLPLLTYSLHDSIVKIKKDWLENNSNYNETSLMNDAAFGYLSGIRMDIDQLGINWCPKVEILTPQEIQKREIEKERNLRRLKRESDRLIRRGRRRLDDLETTLRI